MPAYRRRGRAGIDRVAAARRPDRHAGDLARSRGRHHYRSGSGKDPALELAHVAHAITGRPRPAASYSDSSGDGGHAVISQSERGPRPAPPVVAAGEVGNTV